MPADHFAAVIFYEQARYRARSNCCFRVAWYYTGALVAQRLSQNGIHKLVLYARCAYMTRTMDRSPSWTEGMNIDSDPCRSYLYVVPGNHGLPMHCMHEPCAAVFTNMSYWCPESMSYVFNFQRRSWSFAWPDVLQTRVVTLFYIAPIHF